MGQSPNSKNYTSNPRDNILVQGNADLYNNRVLKRTFTTEVTKTADKDDILMSVRAPVGDIARNQYESIVIGRGIAAIKGNNFLYYQLEKMNNSGFWKKYIAGSTFESINGKDLKSSDIYISNYKEEKSIGNIFQTLTKTIQLHERKYEELALIKKALLQKFFPKKDVIKPEVRYKNFSDAWEQRKLGEITSHRGGTAIEKYFDENGEYKVISIGSYGLNSKYVDQNIRAKSNEITNERVVHAGELTMVLNDKTANGTIIGRSLLIENDNEYVINQRTEIITPKENFNNKFAYTLLNGPFRNKVRRIVQGGTQIYVNYSSVEKLTVFLPNIKEQEKIAEFFHDFDSLIALHQRKLEKLKQLKKFLLQNMFI